MTLVTGASGLIGAALCAVLEKTRRVIRAGRRAVDSGWVTYDATEPVGFDFADMEIFRALINAEKSGWENQAVR